MSKIILSEALAKVDAALKPSSDMLAKANELGAAYRHPEASAARSVWTAAREGVIKQFAAAHIDDIAERQGIDPDTVDYRRSSEAIWCLPFDIAARLAEEVADGRDGSYLWRPVLQADAGSSYHSW